MYCELQFTSAPRGLLPGTSGYCTVKATAGMPNSLRTALEGLSHYRHLFAPGDASSALNPVAWSHTILTAAGQQWHVLSRTQASGFDHTRRSNNFSHHIAISDDRLPNFGPAWLISQSKLLQSAWDQTVGELPTQNRLPYGTESASVCRQWEAFTGDAGWGGVVAAHLSTTSASVVLVFQLGQDVLPLFRESLALLPERQRWGVTFNTFFTGQSASYRLRGVLAGSPELTQLRRLPQVLILDLSDQLGIASAGEYTDAARTGNRRETPTAIQSRPITNSNRESDNDWMTASVKGAKEKPQKRTLSTPPTITVTKEQRVQTTSASTLWLFCGVLVALCMLTTFAVFAIKWSLPSSRTIPNPVRQIVEENPKNAGNLAIAVAGNDTAKSVEAAVPNRSVEKTDDNAFTRVIGRRIFVEPFDDDAGLAGDEKRSMINDYVGLIRQEPKEIPIPRTYWPKDTPLELAFIGLPAEYRLERKAGTNGLPARWLLHDDTTKNILEICVNNSAEPQAHQTLVMGFTIEDMDKMADVALLMANAVLRLQPHDGDPYQISFRPLPRSLDQPVKLSPHNFVEIAIEDVHVWQPSLPDSKDKKHPLFLRNIQFEVELSPLHPESKAQRQFDDLRTHLKPDWKEFARTLKLKWEPSDGSKAVGEIGLVIHHLRLSYLVGNVYVDLLTIGGDKPRPERKALRQRKSNPED